MKDDRNPIPHQSFRNDFHFQKSIPRNEAVCITTVHKNAFFHPFVSNLKYLKAIKGIKMTIWRLSDEKNMGLHCDNRVVI